MLFFSSLPSQVGIYFDKYLRLIEPQGRARASPLKSLIYLVSPIPPLHILKALVEPHFNQGGKGAILDTWFQQR